MPSANKAREERGETMSNAIAKKLEFIRVKGGLKSIDVANVLGLRPETVSRWNQGKAFPQPDAERTLLELEYIVDELSDFYDPQEARLWLFSRQKLLGGQTLAELIQKGRTDEVISMIAQLRDGVFV
jgi:transcriptional regulator with XRE-family HTH domain